MDDSNIFGEPTNLVTFKASVIKKPFELACAGHIVVEHPCFRPTNSNLASSNPLKQVNGST